MTDDSARLGLPYVAAGQLQKHVTVNEAFTRLDSLVQTAVVSRTRSSPPALATEGELYLVGSAPAGAWSGFEAGDLVRADIGGWIKVAPSAGMVLTVLDEGVSLVRLDEDWRSLADTLGGTLQVERMGVGTTADATNPFSARINKALWAARPTDDGGDGDLRFTFNKQNAAKMASILFQSAWSGRAEIGLMGDDDLRLKVSADGSSWSEALRVDRTNGRLWFAAGATRRETTVLTSGSTVSVPSWARWVEAVCVGGGGAGGAGAFGASGTARSGGGGGGAGGHSTAVWPAEHLGPLVVTIGAGGGVSGAAGMASSIATYSNTILKAEGGMGGQIGGAGGAGGAGLSGQASAGGPTGQPAAPFSSGAGGAGGSLSAADIATAGSAGGPGEPCGVTAHGGAGASTGSGGAGSTASLPNLGILGGGGGGGAAVSTGVGMGGGAGGNYGAGGGGGGAGLTAGGAGGPGGAGVVRLTFVG